MLNNNYCVPDEKYSRKLFRVSKLQPMLVLHVIMSQIHYRLLILSVSSLMYHVTLRIKPPNSQRRCWPLTCVITDFFSIECTKVDVVFCVSLELSPALHVSLSNKTHIFYSFHNHDLYMSFKRCIYDLNAYSALNGIY